MKFLSWISKVRDAGLSGRAGLFFPALLLLAGFFLTAAVTVPAENDSRQTDIFQSTLNCSKDFDCGSSGTRLRGNSSGFLQRIYRGSARNQTHFTLKICTPCQRTAPVLPGSGWNKIHLNPLSEQNLLLFFLKTAVPARAAPFSA
ncbi:MAG: hypothetical protein IKD46_01860 [Lentisphaeria bacterium]|nr:hypothetical protein [Lentisphaeria bacterium]